MTENETISSAEGAMRRPLRRAVVIVAMCSVVVLVLAVAAVAFFTAAGAGSGAVVVGSLTPATISGASSSNSAVTITWSAQAGATPASLDDEITYSVLRKPASGAFAQVASGLCSSTLADGTTSCSDSSVPSNGLYSYEVVASLGSFTAISSAVPVTVDATPPTDSVALASPAGAYLNSSTETVYVNTKVGGSFGLADAVQATGARLRVVPRRRGYRLDRTYLERDGEHWNRQCTDDHLLVQHSVQLRNERGSHRGHRLEH
jgi:hypothetical protein